MSTAFITADISEWEDLLLKMFNKAGKAQKLLAVAAQAFAFQDIVDHFAKESGPDGDWKPRSAATQKAYAALFSSGHAKFNPTNKILQLSGDMRKANLPTNIEDVGDNAIRIFNNMVYSATHNFGDATRGIPQREFMWLSDTANKKMADAIIQMIAEAD